MRTKRAVRSATSTRARTATYGHVETIRSKKDRQSRIEAPSRQRARDGVANFIVRVAADDAHLLDLDDRELAMGRGPGWMGHTPWWVPSGDSVAEVRRFVAKVGARMEASKEQDRPKSKARKLDGRNSPGAPSSEVIRYIEKHELTVTPRHHDLQ